MGGSTSGGSSATSAAGGSLAFGGSSATGGASVGTTEPKRVCDKRILDMPWVNVKYYDGYCYGTPDPEAKAETFCETYVSSVSYDGLSQAKAQVPFPECTSVVTIAEDGRVWCESSYGTDRIWTLPGASEITSGHTWIISTTCERNHCESCEPWAAWVGQ